jgi:hypothetical protein
LENSFSVLAIAILLCHRQENNSKKAIFFLPILWAFRYYDAQGRVGDIKGTHDKGSPKLRATFKSRLVGLAQLLRKEWHSGYCKALSGEGDGLFEIRFKADGVMQRPLGFFSDDYELTLLFWAIEKGNRFVPRSACITAQQWKQLIEKDRSLSNEYWGSLE